MAIGTPWSGHLLRKLTRLAATHLKMSALLRRIRSCVWLTNPVAPL